MSGVGQASNRASKNPDIAQDRVEAGGCREKCEQCQRAKSLFLWSYCQSGVLGSSG